MIHNARARDIPATISLEAFGRAMADANLSSLPPEKRASACMAHLARVIIASTLDRASAAALADALIRRARARQ